ncbi:uncharacterized protein LOC143973662 isoform X3 [Lithobates pipiens]
MGTNHRRGEEPRSPEMSRRRAEPAQSSTHNYTKQEESEDESNTDLEPTNPHTDVSITNVRHPSFTIHAEVCLWNPCQRLPDEKMCPSPTFAIPASPFMQKFAYGTGVSVYLMKR